MTLFAKEPVLTLGGIAAAVVAVLAIFGVVVETSLVETLVAVFVPLALTALARRRVTPNAKVPTTMAREVSFSGKVKKAAAKK